MTYYNDPISAWMRKPLGQQDWYKMLGRSMPWAAKKPTATPYAYKPTTVPSPFDVYEVPPVSVAEKGIDIIPGLKWMMQADGSYKYYTRDATGNWTEVPALIAEMMIDDYRTQQAGKMTPYQQATLDFNRQQAEQQRIREQQQAEQQRQREQQQVGREIDAAERERARLQLAAQQPAMTYEERQRIAAEEREKLLKRLEGSPIDWIQYWQTKYSPEWRASIGAAEAGAAQDYIERATEMSQRPEIQAQGLYPSIQSIIETAGNISFGGGLPPELPPAPRWLPQFAPSQRAGVPITKGEVITPSLQQWGRTPGDIQQALEGYMRWTGQPYQTMLQEQEWMRPETPRGVGSKAWMPARRR